MADREAIRPVQVLTPGSILGHAVRRREDPRLITGTGRYVDDIQPDRCLHVAFVRSTLAHATIRALDVAAAAAAPGVVAVLTAADLGLPARVGFQMVPEVFARLPLADGRVRFVGEPVALVVAGETGGGFGAKAGARPELIVVAAAARKLGRPVKWIETRPENLVGMTHGRGQVQQVELGATRDGHLVGLRARVLADVGAYPGIATLLPFLTGQMSAGVYAIPAISYEAHCVVTNTTPLAAYRGAGRPEAAAMVERAMDMLAVELAIDPAELRRRNLIAPDRFPHTTAGGAIYDSGEYERALDKLLEISAYPEQRAEQARRRERGDRLQLGIGISVYVEVTAMGIGPEWGAVRIETDGTATVRCGTTSYGQGHETSLAQIAADQLGLPLDSVRLIHSDTDAVERGTGTVGSRSMQHGGSAVHQAAREG